METATLLFGKIRNGNATDQERQAFYALLREDSSLLDQLVDQYPQQFEGVQTLAEGVKEEILEAILGVKQEEEVLPSIAGRGHFVRRFRWVAAAVLILIAGATGYMIMQKGYDQKPLTQEERLANHIEPGRTGAILKLSNGKEILLDTAKNGLLADGFIKGTDALSVTAAAVEYAEVITPKGRMQSIVLSDGTRVWLNAGSSIRFPTVFNGDQREVSMTGEVYFEVAKDELKHFFVQTKTDRIEVKGTHFNINAYGEVKTTLLEGAVQIGQTMLQPGKQYRNGVITDPDLEEVMAWKNGMFRYDGADLKEIMGQIERWYDVEIQFEGDISKLHFTGGIERSENVAVLLKKLELTGGVEFTIKEKTIIVQPKLP